MDDEMDLIDELVEELMEVLDAAEVSYAMKIAVLETAKAGVLEER